MQKSDQSHQDNIKFPDIDFISISTSWTNKCNKEKLIIELSRRHLKTSGLVSELKTRLQKYLKGEAISDDIIYLRTH